MDHQYFNSTIISEINKMKMLNVRCNNVLVHCLLKVFQSYHVGVGSSFNASSQLQISWFEPVDIIFHSIHSLHLHHCSLPPPACNCVTVYVVMWCSRAMRGCQEVGGRMDTGAWLVWGLGSTIAPAQPPTYLPPPPPRARAANNPTWVYKEH